MTDSKELCLPSQSTLGSCKLQNRLQSQAMIGKHAGAAQEKEELVTACDSLETGSLCALRSCLYAFTLMPSRLDSKTLVIRLASIAATASC